MVTRPEVPPAVEAGTAEVNFPQVARLELDELLEQLVARAQEVLSTQGRLQGLLAATRAIAADLSLPVLLRRIAEAACELVGARYGALGVIGPDNQLTEFITVGVDDRTAERIGYRPHGAGLLGLLISDPRPLRLAELGEHPQAAGFPAGHPPMHSFLGVPIRVRDQVFGNVYVTEKIRENQFSAEDEELLSALASAAGVAIENARLYEAAQRRQHWLEVSAEIVGELLAGETNPLQLIAARARQVAEADLAAILVPVAGEPDSLLVAAADGVGAPHLKGRLLPRSRSLAGRALAEDRDLVVDDAMATGRVYRAGDIPLGPALVVRIRGAGRGQPGVLSLSRATGARRFVPDERDMVAGFAGHAGLALELAQAQETRRQLVLFTDRERIARDLHDLVIQRLFATGLGMNSLAATTQEPGTRERLGEFTDDLDGTVRAIRQTIFQLQQVGEGTAFRGRLLTAIRDLTPALGFAPDLQLDGPLDTTVPPRVAEHAIATLREALTNVIRHAQASAGQVVVSLSEPGQLVLTVTDNGVGLGHPPRSSGLGNMASRAEELGGRCWVTSPVSPDGRGTKLHWSVPLASG